MIMIATKVHLILFSGNLKTTIPDNALDETKENFTR